jgi:drug/metabolite transporter superfamily protein YnfA
MGSPMRTLGFRTHVLLAIAGAIGVLYSLTRPWYAAAPPPKEDDAGIGDIHGPLNAFMDGARRWMSGADGTSGVDSLAHWGQAIGAMAILATVGVLLCLAPRLQTLGRDLARYGGLFAMGLIAWKLVDPPGANEAFELRVGALLAGLFSLVLFTCASGVANAPMRKKVAQRTYQAPPPPPAYEPGV